VHVITDQAQLYNVSNLERHWNQIIVPLTTDNNLAIHYITWPVWEIAADGCFGENQPGFLNPTRATIICWPAFGLVKIYRLEMHNHRAVVLENLGNSRIVDFDYGVHA